MTAHPFGYLADHAGHVLRFTHPPERDYLRTAACTAQGCPWTMPAPGTGYARARVQHTKYHREVVSDVC